VRLLFPFSSFSSSFSSLFSHIYFHHSVERDAEAVRRKEQLKEKREKRMLEAVEEWKKSDIISHWETKKNDKRTKELLWQGVPPNMRCLVWPLAMSNNLQITKGSCSSSLLLSSLLFYLLSSLSSLFSLLTSHFSLLSLLSLLFFSLFFLSLLLLTLITLSDLYDICGKQGKAARARRRLSASRDFSPSSPSSSATDEDLTDNSRVNSVSLIELDLPRTFPALTIFNKDGPCHQQLLEILEAYVCYRPDIGYVQGMSFIAAVLLLYLEPFPAFVCLANLLSRPLFVSFYRMEGDKVHIFLHFFLLFLLLFIVPLHSFLFFRFNFM
jgi:hypothetical protein